MKAKKWFVGVTLWLMGFVAGATVPGLEWPSVINLLMIVPAIASGIMSQQLLDGARIEREALEANKLRIEAELRSAMDGHLRSLNAFRRG